MSASAVKFPKREGAPAATAGRLDAITRSVAAARRGLEDEGRPEFDCEEQLEASALLAEALGELRRWRKEVTPTA